MKSRALKKTRAELAVLISRRCFPKYNEFVGADEIVNNVHPLLLHNRDKFLGAFTKRVRMPLYNICEDRKISKRHCISFLRRLSSYYGNALVSKRKCVIVNGRARSVYEYALIRVR